MRTLVLFVLLCVIMKGIEGKRRGQEKIWKKRMKICEKDTCSHLHPDEGMNCVNKCTSVTCFEQVYGDDQGGPLEDGEVDTIRGRKFTACLRKEARYVHEKKVKRVCHLYRDTLKLLPRPIYPFSPLNPLKTVFALLLTNPLLHAPSPAESPLRSEDGRCKEGGLGGSPGGCRG